MAGTASVLRNAEGDLDAEMAAIAGAIIKPRTGTFDPSTFQDRHQIDHRRSLRRRRSPDDRWHVVPLGAHGLVKTLPRPSRQPVILTNSLTCCLRPPRNSSSIGEVCVPKPPACSCAVPHFSAPRRPRFILVVTR